MNTTNNITTFLESLSIIDTNLENPSYDKIFTLLSENDGVSYYIDLDKNKNRLITDSIDLIQLSDLSTISVDGCDVLCTSCLLPAKLAKNMSIVYTKNEKNAKNSKVYTLSIKNRAKLKKMLDSSFFNKEGLCFDQGKFIGIYKQIPTLDMNLDSIYCHDECD